MTVFLELNKHIVMEKHFFSLRPDLVTKISSKGNTSKHRKKKKKKRKKITRKKKKIRDLENKSRRHN